MQEGDSFLRFTEYADSVFFKIVQYKQKFWVL